MNKAEVQVWSKRTAILAALFGFLQIYPSIVKVVKTKNVSSFSKRAQIMGLVSAVLWWINAYLQGDTTSLVALTIAIAFSSYILYLMYSLEKTKKEKLQ